MQELHILDDLLTSMGEAGTRLTEMAAAEGGAGNLSICVRQPFGVLGRFPISEAISLPVAVPELGGATVLVTGSGQRLRELRADPEATIACVVIDEGGRSGRLLTSERRRFKKITSEFNSHLAVHAALAAQTGGDFLALVHAQPLHLTYLSHIPRYHDERTLNERLLTWQPETIMNLPEGMGFIPFRIPGSLEMAEANAERMLQHRLVIWARHGVMARSDTSILSATDLVDYAETAARYEYLDLAAGSPAQRLSLDDLRAICRSINLEQKLY